jgi:hypothetical protein
VGVVYIDNIDIKASALAEEIDTCRRALQVVAVFPNLHFNAIRAMVGTLPEHLEKGANPVNRIARRSHAIMT